MNKNWTRVIECAKGTQLDPGASEDVLFAACDDHPNEADLREAMIDYCLEREAISFTETSPEDAAGAILRFVDPDALIVPMDNRGEADEGMEYHGTYIGVYWYADSGFAVCNEDECLPVDSPLEAIAAVWRLRS